MAGTQGLADAAVARTATALCTDTVQSILNTALAAERIATTLYYAALTTPAVMRSSALAGRSGNPNDPGLPPGGSPQHVRFLQAALDAELKHAALLSAAGAHGDLGESGLLSGRGRAPRNSHVRHVCRRG
jgi:hypothetical protein